MARDTNILDSLSSVLQGLTVEAVNTQELLRDQYLEDLEVFLAQAQPDQPAQPDRELPDQVICQLAPPFPFLRSQEISCRARLEVRRERGFSIGARLVNMGYELRYGSSESSDSTITLEVEQVPSAKASRQDRGASS